MQVWDEFQLSRHSVSDFGSFRNFGYVLSMLCFGKRYADVIRLFMELRSTARYVVTSFDYRALVSSYVALGDIASAESVAADALAAGIYHQSVWNSLLDYFALRGDVATINCLLQRIIEMRVALDACYFNALLKAHGRAACGKSVAAAESVIDRMVRFDVQPGVVTFTMLMDIYVTADDIKGAESVLARMYYARLQPNVVTFTTLMSAYSSRGDIVGAEAVFKRMEVAKVCPTVVTFTTLMSAYSTCGDIVGAEAVFKRMEDSTVKADIVTFGTLMSAYAGSGDVIGAEAVFKLMGDAKMQPGTVLFHTLLSAYVAVGDVAGVEAVRKRMTEAGLQLDEPSCGLLAQFYRKSGNVDSLELVLQSAVASGVRLSDVTCSQLIALCDRDVLASPLRAVAALAVPWAGPLMFMAEADLS